MSSVFFDYYTDERPPRNLIRLWRAGQDARVRAAFDITLELLESKADWSDIDAVKRLERECAGLWEVIIDLKDRKPYRHVRPIGVWRPDEPIFILLGAFEKSGRIRIPQDACAEALKYKAQYEAGRGTIDDHI